MRTLRRLVSTLLFLVPLMAVAVLAALSLKRYLGLAQEHLPPIVAEEVRKITGHEVSIGRIRIQPGAARIYDVRMARSATFRQSRGDTLATAREVILDLDFRRLIVEKNPAVPLFQQMEVRDPTAYMRRSPRGAFNFMDLFAKAGKPPPRPIFGTIIFSGGVITFDDAGGFHNPGRSPLPFHALFRDLNGHVDFFPDHSIAWAARARETTGQAGNVVVTGSYVPGREDVFFRITADRVSTDIVKNLMPPAINVWGGDLAGDVSIYRRLDARKREHFDIQANASVQAASAQVRGLSEPIRNISGAVAFTYPALYWNLDASLAGTALHSDAALLDINKPVLRGTMRAHQLRLAGLLRALGMQTRFAALKRMDATGDANVAFAGPLDRLFVTASGPVRFRGALPGGVEIPSEARARYAFSGSVQRPFAQISGSIPAVKVRGVVLRNASFSAYTNGDATSGRLQASAGGGYVGALARILRSGPTFRYRVFARLRDVELHGIPVLPETRLAGVLSADVSLNGTGRSSFPSGSANVQVSDLNLNSIRARNVSASIISQNGVLTLRPLVIRDPAGIVVASGTVSPSRHALDLRVDGDDLALADLPLPEQVRRAALKGTVYVRDAHIYGDWNNPSLAGTARGYDIAVGQHVRLDYATVRAEGNLRELNLSEGQVWRFPGFAALSGTVRDILSPRAQIDVAGTFDRIDLEDLVRMAGADVQASGTAQGDFAVEGYLSRPIIVANNLQIQAPTLGAYTFENLSADVTADFTQSPGILTAGHFDLGYRDPSAPEQAITHITGNAQITTDRRFSARAAVDRMDLGLLTPLAQPYAELSGFASVDAEVSGRMLQAGGYEFKGKAATLTQDLKINNEPFPDFAASLAFNQDGLEGTLHPVGGSLRPDATAPGIHLDRIAVDYPQGSGSTPSIGVQGRVRGVLFQTIRSILQRSPAFAEKGPNAFADWLQRIEHPFGGTLNAVFAVAGPPSNPDVHMKWSSDHLTIDDQPVAEFSGDIGINRKVLVVNRASVRLGAASLAMEGSVVVGGSIEGDLSLNNLSLDAVRRWLPQNANLAQLSGNADEVDVRIAGTTRDPVVTATLDLSAIHWTDPNPNHPPIQINLPRVLTSAITISGGRLSVPDIGIQVKEPPRVVANAGSTLTASSARSEAAGTAATKTLFSAPPPPAVYEVHASGDLDFVWQPPFIPTDASVNLSIRVKQQGLGLLTSIFPQANLVMDGTIQEASLDYHGSLDQFRSSPARGVGVHATQPTIAGAIRVTANRIAGPFVRTEVRNLDARFHFDGDTLHTDRFTAHTAISGRGGSVILSDPIVMSGSLPVSAPQPGEDLTISAPRVLFMIAPLPRFTSGSILGELTTTNPGTGRPEPVHIEGAFFSPTIRGTVYLHDVLFRLPSDFAAQPGAQLSLPIVPAFDLRIAGNRNIHVTGAWVNAYVFTAPTDPIHIAGSLDDPQITGTIKVDHGVLTFPTMRFNIVRGGETTLRYPYFPIGAPQEKTFMAMVNLSARGSLTATSVTGRTRRYTVTVDARGPISGLEPLEAPAEGEPSMNRGMGGLRLSFRSDPPDLALTQEGLQRRITGLLGGEQAIQQLFSPGPNVGRALAQQFTDVFSTAVLPNLFEQAGITKALGLEELQIGYNRLDAFTLQVTRRLLGPFYAGYWRRLSGANLAGDTERAAWELKLSYRVRSNLQFSWTTDEQHQNAYLLEGVLRY
ncbi:MAG: translocation/assembly module TamB domain-containing protein [Chthonomonadales bacterium]